MLDNEAIINLFRTYDTDDSGWMDMHELQKALSSGHFHYDLHTVKAVARLFTPNRLGNTSLSVTQFISMYTWLDNVMARFNAALEPGHTALPRAAARAALNAQLADECTELKLNRAHFAVDDLAFDAFLDSADADAGASIDPPEFLRAAVALRALVSVFGAFDTDKDGRINLNFSQMVYLMAHVI